MRLLPALLPALLALAACGTKAPPVAPAHLGPPLADAGREVRLLVPPDTNASHPLPLVVVLGGYSWRSWELAEWMGLPAHAAARSWLLLIPEGSLDRKGNPFWAATETCCDWYGAGVDDAAFLARVIDDAMARHPVDPSRVVVVGHSNGGFMGFALACQGQVPLTHLVSIAGSSHLDPAACAQRPPLALLQVQGDADRIQPPEGDKLAPGARTVLERWTTGPLVQGALPADAGAGEAWIAPGQPIALWALSGVDHYPPLDGPLGHAIADWIDRTPAPAP